jgi:hypothetical protein
LEVTIHQMWRCVIERRFFFSNYFRLSKKGRFKMPTRQTVTFQEALEIIESLPEYQQEDLIDIIRHRLIERRRQFLAESIREARDEYVRGEVKKGTVDDLMRDLSE